MYSLSKESLEWSLNHILSFYDSDFYPSLFEFKAIKHDWVNMSQHLQDIDLEKYAPISPFASASPKPNGGFRIVHQLDPVDSLIYASLAYDNLSIVEKSRINISRKIACSYRFEVSNDGSMFSKNVSPYKDFMSKSEDLSKKYSDGYVLICDLVDFFNQIYLHRVSNVLEEFGSDNFSAFEKFLTGLNSNISKGIPVGPAASIVVSEAIMADIDNKILSLTSDFTRYVDDIHIFVDTKEIAVKILHDLTGYLHSNHRLVFSSEKTKIISSIEFFNKNLKNEEAKEKTELHNQINQIEKYPNPEFDKLDTSEKFKIRIKAYVELFQESIKYKKLDLGLMRHILRQAGKYKVKSIIPNIFENFDILLPVIRDIVIYFTRVLNDNTVQKYNEEFENLLSKPYLNQPYINIWIFTLFQNLSFNSTNIIIDMDKIIRIREKALLVRRTNNKTWLKEIKNSVDDFGPWDKRAIIHASIILSKDEMRHWLGLVSSKGTALEKAICSKVVNDKKGN